MKFDSWKYVPHWIRRVIFQHLVKNCEFWCDYLNYSKLLCFIVASVSLTDQNLSQYTPNHTTHGWYGHTQPVSQQIPSPLPASWWPSDGKVGSHVQPNPTPNFSGDGNPDLPCSFVKVIPTVVVHSIAATPQFRRKNANYTVILFMARNLWRLFPIPFPPFLFFFITQRIPIGLDPSWSHLWIWINHEAPWNPMRAHEGPRLWANIKHRETKEPSGNPLISSLAPQVHNHNTSHIHHHPPGFCGHCLFNSWSYRDFQNARELKVARHHVQSKHR